MKAFLLILCQGLGLALFAYGPFVDCARTDVRVCIVDQDGAPVPKYPEQAMNNANFQKTLCWEYRRERGKAVVAHDPPLDKCLVFRTRTEVDDKGELVSAHYGYLGEKVSFETGLGILSVFNPTANDVRLEDCGAVEDFLRRERIRWKIRE